MSAITLNTWSEIDPYEIDKHIVTLENDVLKTKDGELAYIEGTTEGSKWPPRCMNDVDAFWACTDPELIMMVSGQVQVGQNMWGDRVRLTAHFNDAMKQHIRANLDYDPDFMGGDGWECRCTGQYNFSIKFLPKNMTFTVVGGIGLIPFTNFYKN